MKNVSSEMKNVRNVPKEMKKLKLFDYNNNNNNNVTALCLS